ncbi:MAG: alpha/beta hydrolase [Alistipes putredinis]|nr:MAG: alpha/beta hydrolase [Alistipes putredinis]
MDFETTAIPMPDDYEGQVITTIIKAHATVSSARAVLYVHGYTDYFFQEHFAERMTEHGLNFYAVDLRKYGRSLLPWQHPNYCRDMSEYYPDIDKAVETILADGNTDITLVGHSTGGLLCALYCAFGDRRKSIGRLILNSPFLEFNVPWVLRKTVIPVVAALGKSVPLCPHGECAFSRVFQKRALVRKRRVEFQYGIQAEERVPALFRMGRSRKTRPEYYKKQDLALDIPILLMSSEKSNKGRAWNYKAAHSDTVLDVEHIRRYGMRLGDDVESVSFRGGLH